MYLVEVKNNPKFSVLPYKVDCWRNWFSWWKFFCKNDFCLFTNQNRYLGTFFKHFNNSPTQGYRLLKKCGITHTASPAMASKWALNRYKRPSHNKGDATLKYWLFYTFWISKGDKPLAKIVCRLWNFLKEFNRIKSYDLKLNCSFWQISSVQFIFSRVYSPLDLNKRRNLILRRHYFAKPVSFYLSVSIENFSRFEFKSAPGFLSKPSKIAKF